MRTLWSDAALFIAVIVGGESGRDGRLHSHGPAQVTRGEREVQENLLTMDRIPQQTGTRVH